MKNIIVYSLIISSLLFSCGDKGDNSNSTTNAAPSKPVIKSPVYGDNCVTTPVTLEWNNAVDSDGIIAQYEVEISKDDTFTNVLEKKTTPNTTLSVNLSKSSVYYWRVKAIDGQGLAGSPSVISKFIVPADALSNQLPTIPSLIFPLDKSEIANATKVVLKWNPSSDADLNDVITYEVYQGTITAQNKVVDKLTSTSYELTVMPGSEIYWKIKARDSKGGVTISPIWSFRVKN